MAINSSVQPSEGGTPPCTSRLALSLDVMYTRDNRLLNHIQTQIPNRRRLAARPPLSSGSPCHTWKGALSPDTTNVPEAAKRSVGQGQSPTAKD